MRSLRSFCVPVTTLGFLLALTLCQPTALLAQRRQQQGSRELPAPRYIPNHDFDTQNIKLDLRFDWEQQQALGTETITLSSSHQRRSFEEWQSAVLHLDVCRSDRWFGGHDLL